MTGHQAVKTAIQRAQRENKSMLVVTINRQGDGRQFTVVEESHVDRNPAEFAAFDGHIVAVIEPDGTVS